MDNAEVMEGLSELAEPVRVLQDNESEENVTLRLTDAAPFVLHQQAIADVEDDNTEESSDSAGTYNIIAQQLMPTGQVQLTLSDGINILQTTIAADQLQGFETGEQSILLQAADVDAKGEISYVAADITKLEPTGADNHTQQEETSVVSNNEQPLVETSIQPDNQSERILQVINQSVTAAQDTDQSSLPSGTAGQFFILTDEDKTKRESNVIGTGVQPAPNVKQFVENMVQQEQMNSLTSSLSAPLPTEYSIQELQVDQVPEQLAAADVDINKPIKEEKKPDLSKPIEVTDHMEVVVNGKKCLLKVNPDTGQLCAYPLLSTGKRRGRPKKSEAQAKSVVKEQTSLTEERVEKLEPDQTSSAAQGLLELSNTGPDGVRRSARSRGKPKTLEEYEVFELSSDDDAAADDGDDEVLPSGAIRKRKSQTNKDYIPPATIQTPGVPRRGRGRPRRYPRPDDTPVTNQIPAVIIPSGDGQTIMMAPLQGLTNFEAFQEQVKNMPIFQQSGTEDDSLQYLNISGLIDSADGNTVSVQLGGAINLGDTDDIAEQSVLNNDSTEDNTEDSAEVKPAVGTSETEDNDAKEVKAEIEKESVDQTDSGIKEKASETGEGQPTIIQIPENLLPMFTQKKDPVKIGLKASDAHLEKMKCSMCDFQGYYEQQYQDHILTHEEVIKCKCCKFASFEKEVLIEHFKKNHPRCICSYCDHMAEHAYIIKRHTMRHTQVGCKCDVCGKVYKDQYVLKMHVKMVHMPAEVLFECNVCSKKFTRKAHLKRHLRIHDPEKPFKCPQCQYRGCEKSDIVKHLLVHEDPKHQCSICNKSFRHIKNKELHMKRHNGQRDYKCGVCDFYGYTFTDIRKHIERKHTDCKSLICDKCGMVFRSEQLFKEHKAQVCDVFMIEQALAIATSDGGTTQATIQIPSNYSLDGNQQLQVGGQSMSIDKDGQITVHSVGLPGDAITLTDEQIQAVAQGQISESDLQNLVSQAQLSESELQAAVSQGQIIDTGQTDDENVTVMQEMNDEVRTEIQVIGSDVRPVLDLYKSESDDNDVRRVLMYKSEVDDVTLTEEEEEDEEETTMDEDDIRDEEEQMDGIGSDSDDKTNIDNDQIMGMVNIMR
ncbi:zinc finger protein 236-like [Mercenaria mercenaria]|uniref:zinc finger protein 236-like n=1 Tax=Mercenaria mercenaria TaxID=6596 RepID=UPI00234F4C83|nr:zinc finger protein 236-like [Mercenaria mercenaria]